jgi:hypothetical protein
LQNKVKRFALVFHKQPIAYLLAVGLS